MSRTRTNPLTTVRERRIAHERADFIRRLQALGYETPTAAARALGLDRTGVWRIWQRQRGVSRQARRLLHLLEASQPCRITPAMVRVLRTAAKAEAGNQVTAPPARSRWEARWTWDETLEEMVELGIIARWKKRYLLTELGARARSWADTVLPEE